MGNFITTLIKYLPDSIKNYNKNIKYVDKNNVKTKLKNLTHLNHGFKFGYNQYYTLYIYFHDDETRSFYTEKIEQHNKNDYFKSVTGTSIYTFDSGFDLYSPTELELNPKSTICIDLKVSCSMKMGSRYVGYYLYPRSSTGSRTPLRMANSVGIIDSGYRGRLQVYFDNISDDTFTITRGNRYVQICPPSLEYPVYVVVVDTLEELGTSQRGENGFGSTGN